MTMKAQARPVSVCLAHTASVRSALDDLLASGCTVKSGSIKEGHLIVQDDGETVYQALQKGNRHQPWLVSCYNSPHIRWTRD